MLATNVFVAFNLPGRNKTEQLSGLVFGSYSNYSRPLMEFARESSLRLRQQDTQKFLLPREGVVPRETTERIF